MDSDVIRATSLHTVSNRFHKQSYWFKLVSEAASDTIGVQENGVWRRRMNHELARLFGEPSIQKVAKAGRVRWTGHVARLPDNNPAKMVFALNPVCTRRRGAQRVRWLDQVQQDLENVGQNRSWRDTAMDRVNWRNIVNEVLSN